MIFYDVNKCNTEYSDDYFDPSRADEFPLCSPPIDDQRKTLAHDGVGCRSIPGHIKDRNASLIRAYLMWTLKPDESPWWLDSTLCVDHQEDWELNDRCRFSVEIAYEDIPF